MMSLLQLSPTKGQYEQQQTHVPLILVPLRLETEKQMPKVGLPCVVTCKAENARNLTLVGVRLVSFLRIDFFFSPLSCQETNYGVPMGTKTNALA